jgi:hypothetical protein
MERLTLLGSSTSSTAATAVRSCSVQAQAVGFRFHVGEAQVSGYVLLTSGASISLTQTVTLHHGQR